ncbi:MAG: SHOCT domain-containing protein, partial [Ktedonobacterales bacterium]
LQQQQQAATVQPQYAPPQPALMQASAAAPEPPLSAAPERDPIEALKQLGELKAAGVLTDEEFEAKKAVLLKQI